MTLENNTSTQNHGEESHSSYYDWFINDEKGNPIAYKKTSEEPIFLDKERALKEMSALILEQKNMIRGELNRFNAIFIGIQYGYPTCCIKEFMQDLYNTSNPYHTRNIPDNKTGFIPCRKHTQEVLEGKITLASLIKDRKHDVPFTHWEQPQINIV